MADRDLISKAAAIDALKRAAYWQDAERKIVELPAVDAAPVVHGRWERDGSDGIVCCSVCGIPMSKTHVCWPDGGSGYYYVATNYCAHCGASMEKGDCDA